MEHDIPVVAVTDGAESKGRKIISAHAAPTDDRVWSSALAQQQVKGSRPAAYFRNLYAIQDEGPEDQKSSYRLLHHFIGKDGQPGAASTRACSEIIEWLNKGLFPTVERQALYEHLSAHLHDAKQTVPELRPIDNYLYPLDEEVKHAMWQLDTILARVDDIRGLRALKGMTLTQARLTQLESLQQRFAALCTLVSMKYLYQPTEEVLAHMGDEAKAETIRQKIEAMQAKVKVDTDAVERTLTETVVKRIQAKLDASRST